MKTIADKELKRCRELITSIKKGILITHKNEVLKGRPMILANVDEACNIWFFAKNKSEKVKQIRKNNEVFVVYANTAENSYVTVRGKIEIDEDKGKVKKFLNSSITPWLPQSCEASNTVLLKLIPEEIEYWDGNMNKFAILFNTFSPMSARKQTKDLKQKRLINADEY